jgi:hypothetical protein
MIDGAPSLANFPTKELMRQQQPLREHARRRPLHLSEQLLVKDRCARTGDAGQ